MPGQKRNEGAKKAENEREKREIGRNTRDLKALPFPST
jgi:hypothetical protein